jgi:hypothetical protein
MSDDSNYKLGKSNTYHQNHDHNHTTKKSVGQSNYKFRTEIQVHQHNDHATKT